MRGKEKHIIPTLGLTCGAEGKVEPQLAKRIIFLKIFLAIGGTLVVRLPSLSFWRRSTPFILLL